MRNLKFIHIMVLNIAAIVATSCGDMLDLAPIDNYGSTSYWKTESQVSAYIDGLHKQLRDMAEQHIITFGELRGGHYKDGTSADGLAISSGEIRLQNLSKETPGVTKFGNIYGCITNINLFIARVTDANFIPEAKKNYYLGQAYGLRAFYYFDLYRVYGGVPIRLGVEVIDGVLDPNKLYLGRAKPSEVISQIKKDLETSLQYFGENSDFNSYGHGTKVYWSKAATECLAGEVYLWNSKVTIGDNKATESDLSKAKKYLKDVEGNYGLQLQQDFKRIFSADNKGNSEVIMAVSYMEGEAENSLSRGYTYSLVSGTTNKDSFREMERHGMMRLIYRIMVNRNMSINFRFIIVLKKVILVVTPHLCLHIGKRKVENCMYMVLMYVKIWALSMLREIESMMVILFFIVYPGYI